MIDIRDRDVSVTIPVLLRSRQGMKRDGIAPATLALEVLEEDGVAENLYDEAVMVLKPETLDALRDPKKFRQLERTFGVRLSDDMVLNLMGLIQLTHAYKTRNIGEVIKYREFRAGQLVRKAFSNEKGWYDLALQQATNQSRQLPQHLSREVNRHLYKTRFVSWWVIREKQFAPGILCPDLETALYALLAVGLGAKKAFAICQLSNCRKQFFQTKKTQRFCSLRCANTARKRRERGKK